VQLPGRGLGRRMVVARSNCSQIEVVTLSASITGCAFVHDYIGVEAPVLYRAIYHGDACTILPRSICQRGRPYIYAELPLRQYRPPSRGYLARLPVPGPGPLMKPLYVDVILGDVMQASGGVPLSERATALSGSVAPHAGSGVVRMDLLRFLAGYRIQGDETILCLSSLSLSLDFLSVSVVLLTRAPLLPFCVALFCVICVFSLSWLFMLALHDL